ncbi:hypothetical protein [Caenimonas aquaedulcis]|uniref:Tandem-95 repeat protein n=1 Tax=Caenimonas aquaedulcis TaxID=2793270 RepID=A0A931H4N2_9BURK|nr:hypothetical protein [Caenimonas aquaedulcis]MBG9388418.1 hypothetical protein [Caenimonas aquaedulcis]
MANHRPVIKHGRSSTYLENGAAKAIDPGLTLADADGATLSGATVQAGSGYVPGVDLVGFTPAPGINGTFDALSGTLTFTGTATLSQYEALLRSVTYASTSDDPPTRSLSFAFQVHDGQPDNGASAVSPLRVKIAAVNDAPQLTAAPTLVYTTAQAPAFLDPAMVLSDPDSDIKGARVTVAGGYVMGQDVLSATGTHDIRVRFDAATGTLTLKGQGSAAAYQAVLQTVTYTNTATAPSLDPRTITVQVEDKVKSDGGALGNLAVIGVVYAGPPVLTTSAGPVVYAEGGAPVVLDATLTLSDADDAMLAGATVTISSGFRPGDELVFAGGGSIAGHFDGAAGVLTLTGAATVANYEAALRTVQFASTDDSPGVGKTITWLANDGTGDSSPAITTIAVTPVNDAPGLAAAATLAYTENGTASVIAPSATVVDVDSADFNGGSLTVGFVANGTPADRLAILDQGSGPGEIGISGGTVRYEGAVIGTATGGSNGGDLVVAFDSAAATPAAVQALVRDIAFSNTSDDPSTLARTVRFTVSDGDGFPDAATDTATVNVAATNDLPVAIAASGASYVEDGAAFSIDPLLAIHDADDADLSGATVTISSGFQPGDTLVFAGGGAISGTFDGATGMLVLTGTDTLANWQAALRSVQFVSTNDSPVSAKTLTWTVNDGSDDSAATATAIAVTPVNDAPVLAASGTLAYTENGGAASVWPSATIADPDSADFAGGSVSVSFTGNGTSSDQLTLVDQGAGAGQIGVSGGIVSYQGTAIGLVSGGAGGSDLVITFDSTAATTAAVQALLRDIAFSNTSDHPSTLSRAVLFTVGDGDGGAGSASTSATIDLIAVNDAPVVAASGSSAYTEGGGAVAVDAAVSIADPDSATLASATVQVTGGFLPGEDVLAFAGTAATGNISAGAFDAATGTLALTSAGATASAAQWQAALAAVTFDTSSTSPGDSRVISTQVNDGQGAHNLSNIAAQAIAITEVNSRPVVTTSAGPAAFVEDTGGPLLVDAGLAVTDPDTGSLTGVTVRISAGLQSAQDVLAFTPSGAITGGYDAAAGTLTLSGAGTLAQYRAALASVTYDNTSDTPDGTTRTLEFQVNDGQSVSNLSLVATRTLTVAASNDAPVLALGTTLAYTENDPATAIAPAATVGDTDSGDFNGGSLTVGFTAAGTAADQLGVIHQGNSAGQIGVSGAIVSYGGSAIGSYTGGANGSALVVTFDSATATPAAVQALVRAISFSNTSESPSTSPRTIEFTLVDGDGGSDTASGGATVPVVSVNDTPVATHSNSTALAYIENDAATVIDGSIALADADSTTLAGATVAITGNYASGQDVLAFTPGGGITGSFNAATGELTLSGGASPAAYETALHSVTYANTSEDPATATRTISFQVDDGAGLNHGSNPITRDIAVTSVNDAPVIASGSTISYTENASATLVSSGLTLTDAEGSMTGATVAISGNFASGQDVLSFTPAGVITGSFDAGTGVLTLSGSATAAQYQAALRSVAYANTSDAPSTAARTISFQATDSQGGTSGAATTTVNVTAVNDAPVTTVPANAAVGTAFSNTSLSIPGVSVNDPDAGANPIQATVTAANGGVTFGLAGGAGASGNGTGSVVLSGTVAQVNAALASMSYKSADGFTGPDTLSVSASDFAASSTKSFQVGVVPQVFFIDNADTTADTGNSGTAADPFNTVASFNALAADGAGDYIYLQYGSAGIYSEADGFNLLANQHLVGQGQSLQFTNPVTGQAVTFVSGSVATTPTLSLTGAGNHGVDLAIGNTVTGLNIDTTLGSQTGISDGNGTVGTLTVSDVDVTGMGMAVDIDQGGALDVVIDKLTSTGSTQQGLQLAGTALTGSFAVTAGGISGSAGTAFLVGDGAGTAGTGGSVAINFGGTASSTGTVRTVDIEDRAAGAGSITLSGNLTHTSGNSSGVVIADIAGGAIDFAGALAIDSTGSAGIALSNVSSAVNFTGGSLSVTTNGAAGISGSAVSSLAILGSGNTLSSTNAAAVSLTGVAIAASGLNFSSISSSGGANGIMLNDTGAAGSLTVTGTGAPNSGGTIQNTTADGVSVTSGSIDLGYMLIQNTTGDGILATNLLGTNTLSHSTVTGFDAGGTKTSNGFTIVNSDANLSSLVVSDTTFANAATANDGIFMEAQGTSGMTLQVIDSTFTGLAGDGVQVDGITGSSGTVRITISGSQFSNAAAGNGNGGVSLNPLGDVNFIADISGNTFASVMNPVTTKPAIHVNFTNNPTLGTNGAGNVIISNNLIGQAGPLWTSGNGSANAVLVQTTSGATLTAAVTGNVIDANTGTVIEVLRLRAIGTSTLNATVTGNDIQDTETSNHVEFDATAGLGATQNGTINLSISGNSFNAGGVIKLTENSIGTLNLTQANAAAVASANGGATVAVTGSPSYGQAAPPAASTPSLPLLAHDHFGEGNGGTLSLDELGPIAAAAVQRWQALPLTEAQWETLSHLAFGLADMSGAWLGTSVGSSLVLIDLDAAGHGWWVDHSPLDDAEFSAVTATHGMAPRDAAAGRLDLLTAVMHEIGHVLGLDDAYAGASADSLMYGYLESGERRLPDVHDLIALIGLDPAAGP